MPRTSVQPSRATWVTALAIFLLPALAAAQGQPQAPAQPQQPAQPQAKTPPPAAAPETHTVREGDTLWDLAKKYLNDPFLWPDIYRRNTAVVEDPHWIYPGEVLRIAGGENVAAVPATDTPAPPADSTAAPADTTPSTEGLPELASASDSAAPLFAAPRNRVNEETLRAYTEQPYRALRRSEFYSSGFLTEGQTLPLGKLLGPVTPSQIRSINSRPNATLYTTVAIEAPNGATYQPGDTLLVVEVGNEIKGYGDAIVPTGLARVTGTSQGAYVATIVAVYGAIRGGQRTLPAEKFTPGGNARAVPVTDGVRGRLIGGVKRQDLKAPQMVAFLDKGRQDGVAPGDLFEARRTPARLADGSVRIDEVMAVLQVVHVRDRTATARIINVISPDLPAGTEVRQVAKLPAAAQ